MLIRMHPHGVATRAELVAAGIPTSTITRRYNRILPKIYSAEEPTRIARCYAVTLWQPDALLSHRTAAWLYGWVSESPGVEATIPPKSSAPSTSWLTVYRREIPDRETTEVQCLPVVGRERTLIDCCAVMAPADVARIVDERLAAEMDVDRVRALIRNSPRRRGNARALDQIDKAAVGFASEPERVLDRALIQLGLRLQTNEWVGRYICDFVDELAKVIIEVDGRAYHSAPEVFSRDRTRQNELQLDGWLVLRFSAVDVMAHPEKVARQIAEVVRRRRAARR